MGDAIQSEGSKSPNSTPSAIPSPEPQPSSSWFNNMFGDDFKDKIINSPYSGCARESFMWGIATGTAMGL